MEITIFQLPNANVTSTIFVEYLEATNEILRLSRSSKAVRSVEDTKENVKVNYQSENCCRVRLEDKEYKRL
jgi:hypothetical protein